MSLLSQKDMTDFYDLKKNLPGGLDTIAYFNKLIDERLLDACVILADDAEFFTGDVRQLTAWERFSNAVKIVSPNEIPK